MSKHFTFCIGLWLACTGTALCQTLPRLQKQQQYLDELLRILPKSEPWENWLREKKKLPPDFDALASIPFFPAPIKNIAGRMVTREECPGRRQERLVQSQQYVLRSFPPSPGNVQAASVRSREEPG